MRSSFARTTRSPTDKFRSGVCELASHSRRSRSCSPLPLSVRQSVQRRVRGERISNICLRSLLCLFLAPATPTAIAPSLSLGLEAGGGGGLLFLPSPHTLGSIMHQPLAAHPLPLHPPSLSSSKPYHATHTTPAAPPPTSFLPTQSLSPSSSHLHRLSLFLLLLPFPRTHAPPPSPLSLLLFSPLASLLSLSPSLSRLSFAQERFSLSHNLLPSTFTLIPILVTRQDSPRLGGFSFSTDSLFPFRYLVRTSLSLSRLL